jgi:hypothetical protein
MLPGCHREFTMPDTTQPGHVAINLYVIGRIGKNELGLVVIHQQLVSHGIRGIPADQNVLSEHPDIAQPADRRAARLLGHQVFRLLALIPNTLDNDIDLSGLETGEKDIETDIDQALKLDRQHVIIPACLLRKPIVLHWLDESSILRERPTLQDLGYLPLIRFNTVIDAALGRQGLSRSDIYVTQTFHLVPRARSERISQAAIRRSFDEVTRFELQGRKVIALGEIAAGECARHHIEHIAVCHPSRRGYSNEQNAVEIAEAIARLGFRGAIKDAGMPQDGG